jgi:hypothetical protein
MTPEQKEIKRLKALVRKLWKFAKHRNDCQYLHNYAHMVTRYPCTCGLKKLDPEMTLTHSENDDSVIE